MEIVFLGTSSGTPTKTRNVSGVAIRKTNSKAWCLVDCGEGTQHQILRTNLALSNLQVLLITHVHGDHCYGLPGLMASAAMAGRKEPLTIVGPPEIKDYFEATKKATQLMLPYEVNFVSPNDISALKDEFEFEIDAVELSHRVQSFAYIFGEKGMQRKLDVQKLKEDGIGSGPAWGKIQKGLDIQLSDGRLIQAKNYLLQARPARKIVICGDNDTPSILSEISRSIDVLVHEATYTYDIAVKVGEGPQHCSAKEISRFAQGVSIKNLVLTHFSPRYQDSGGSGATIADVESEARESYSGNLFLANDFDIYQLDIEGELTRL